MSIMRAKLILLVFAFTLNFARKDLLAQNISSKQAYPKWEVGVNGGYFIRNKVPFESYERINPNFLLLAKRNFVNGKNALRFSADFNYDKREFDSGLGLGMPYTSSLAVLGGFERRLTSWNKLRPFAGFQQSFRINFNQALADEFTTYPSNQKPINYSYKNQKDFIFISDIFLGLEYKLIQNLFISGEVSLKLEHFSSKAGGYSFSWLLEDGNNTGVINSAGYSPTISRIYFHPFTFLNLNYKFK